MATYLTKRQREVLDFLSDFIRRNGYSPSLEEICKGLGLSSLATVHVHLRNLEEKGFIRHAWNRSRSIEILPLAQERPVHAAAAVVELPLLGRVAAGRPIDAVEDEEIVEAPREFVRGDACFALKVKGESMIEEQIRDGDTIIVERRETAENGDTVVALLNDREVTVKKFFHEGRDKVRLQPANAAMEPLIVPAASCNIQGVVIGLLRKYAR